MFDAERLSRWIHFDENGRPHSPDDDVTRLVIALPLDEAGAPLDDAVIVDHGTGVMPTMPFSVEM